MEELQEKAVLEELGLTEIEARVYLTLIETGLTKAGVIVKKTKLHRSTTYEVIRRLVEMGLASYVIKAGKRHFRATDPEKFLEVMAEREEKLKSILPALKARIHKSEIKQTAEIFEGETGLKSAFEYALRGMRKGSEAYILVAARLPDSARRFFNSFHNRRAKMGVKANMIISEMARDTIGRDREKNPITQVKYLSEQVITNVNFNIYGDRTILYMWTEKNPIAFLIESKEIADSLKKYFDILWNRDTYTLRGYDGIAEMCEQVLRTGKDVYLIGANGGLPKIFPAFFDGFEKRRVEAGITRHHLAIEETKGTPFSRLKKLRVRYLPREFSSPMVIWVFGDYVAQVLWDDQIVFMVNNKKVANDYRKYFKFLWKNAKP